MSTTAPPNSRTSGRNRRRARPTRPSRRGAASITSGTSPLPRCRALTQWSRLSLLTIVHHSLMGKGGLRMMVRFACATPVAAITLLALAACGGSSDSGTGFEEVFASLQGLSGEERHDRLVELAQEEDELSLYTSMGGDRVALVVDAFEEAFDLDVAVYRANSE